MEAIFSLGLGYCIGCIHPAHWISKRHSVNLKTVGSKNLGATNTALVLGKGAGVFVMLVDILKSILSSRIAKVLFPGFPVAGMVACLGTIVGHCYPVTLHFQGGKGLAAFGGMVLSYKAWFFPAILIPGLALMALLNTGVVIPCLASVMFPVLVAFSDGAWQEICVASITGIFILFMHRDNIKRAIQKQDTIAVTTFLKEIVFKR